MRIFSGIQPTGAKHFGNYSGGFRQYAATQEVGEGFFCLVDLHSITIEYDPDDLRERTLDLAAMLFATGLDPDRSTVFAQSHVAAHAEAAWLLGAVTAFGELRRMTQFKEEVGEAVVQLLVPIQERYEALRADERELQRLLAVGAEKARKESEPTLAAMYERMGFVLPQTGRHFGAARPRGL